MHDDTIEDRFGKTVMQPIVSERTLRRQEQQRLISLIEEQWDDIRVIVVTRNDIEEHRGDEISDEVWELAKNTGEWERFVEYVWDGHDVVSQMDDFLYEVRDIENSLEEEE